MQEKAESNHKKPGKDFWLEHVKKWELSKLSQQAYCTQAGISYPTFVYWRGQYLLDTGRDKAHQFIPVEVRQSQPDISPSVKLKLVTGNVVSIPVIMGISEIAKLIRLLEMQDA
ncbi:MAG: IS66 family insertion sequence element accessory protein TnpA [Gammaproteobacteria bacterium]